MDSDADIDRLMTMLDSATRNPVAFQLGWTQYLLGTLRHFARINPMLDAQLAALIEACAGMRAAAEAWRLPAGTAQSPETAHAAHAGSVALGAAESHGSGREAEAIERFAQAVAEAQELFRKGPNLNASTPRRG